MIVLARVDDRLIHGQVVVGWVNEVKADHIVVINEEVSKNEEKKNIMRLAVPKKIKLSFFSPQEAGEELKNSAFAKSRLLLLFSNPGDVIPLIRAGISIKEVNIGGMRYSSGKKEIIKSVFVSKEDIDALKKLSSLGISIIAKAVPTDRPVDVGKLIQSFDIK
jgi:PTS system mannose-specific IIB component